MKEFIEIEESHVVAPKETLELYVLFMYIVVTELGLELSSVAKFSSEFAFNPKR